MALNKKRPHIELDDSDHNILKALSQDAKISFADLGKKVNLTGPAVHGRVKKMENSDVIKRYGIDIDFNVIGLPVCAFVRVQTGKLSCREAAKLVGQFDEVIECHAVAGEDDLLLKTRTATPLDLQELLDKLKTEGIIVNLLRHLYGAEHVTYARNITDVDDKINDRAARDFPDLPLNEAIRRVTEGTNAQFQADVTALGCLEPTTQPRATEHLEEMRGIIERLVAKGFAYVAEEHVLFSPEAMNKANGKLPAYGSLANRSLDEMIAGARVDVAPYKRGATDFVLWKPSDPGQPGWPSPCGIRTDGRPGWHIECSAMSMAKLLAPFGGGLTCDDPLRNTFDIHGGGIDLVFPHHENEIAQSCCAFGSARMANIWMHNGFLQVEGQKMSKSLGNFTTIADVLRDWPGEVARLAMLKTHYRQPIDWTLKSLEESAKTLEGWYQKTRDVSGISTPPASVISALADGLNTPAMLAAMHQGSEVDLDGAMHLLGFYDSRARGAFSLTNPGLNPRSLMPSSPPALPPVTPKTSPNPIASAMNSSPWASRSWMRKTPSRAS